MSEERDRQGRTLAQRDIEVGNQYPYDCPESWDGKTPLPPARDWAHAAARGILRNLNDRRSIKNGFFNVDQEVREEIVETIAKIIREAAITTREAAWRAGAEAMREAIADDIRISTLPLGSVSAANFPLPPCPPREGAEPDAAGGE